MRALASTPRPAARHWTEKFVGGGGLAEGGSIGTAALANERRRCGRRAPGERRARRGMELSSGVQKVGRGGHGRTDRPTWAPRGSCLPFPPRWVSRARSGLCRGRAVPGAAVRGAGETRTWDPPLTDGAPGFASFRRGSPSPLAASLPCPGPPAVLAQRLP